MFHSVCFFEWLQLQLLQLLSYVPAVIVKLGNYKTHWKFTEKWKLNCSWI